MIINRRISNIRTAVHYLPLYYALRAPELDLHYLSAEVYAVGATYRPCKFVGRLAASEKDGARAAAAPSESCLCRT